MVRQLEQQARERIDRTLSAAGWAVCDADRVNLHAARAIAAKREGVTLTGVETQSDRYTKGMPEGLPRWRDPLPVYESWGIKGPC